MGTTCDYVACILRSPDRPSTEYSFAVGHLLGPLKGTGVLGSNSSIEKLQACVHMSLYLCLYLYLIIYIFTYVCMYVCMYVCIYAYIRDMGCAAVSWQDASRIMHV